MKTRPITPAWLGASTTGQPISLEHGAGRSASMGVVAPFDPMFLAGNGLPECWAGRERFVVLATRFGAGNDFLATWDVWRREPHRCRQLCFIAVEPHPLVLEDMHQFHRDSPWPELARRLCAAWPALTPNLHRLVFDGGQVQLLLALGDVAAWLRELVADVDAFFFDSVDAAGQPSAELARLIKGLGRLAADNATLAAGPSDRSLRDHLASAGFVPEQEEAASGGGVTRAHFAPAFRPKRPPARRATAQTRERHALVLGAGLAGCVSVAALAEHGWATTLVDRQSAPAREASGNPGGLFHGVLHAQDGHHARFNRACALEATRSIRRMLAEAGEGAAALGDAGGLLRLEDDLADVGAMRGLLRQLGLPPAYVQALDAAEASRCAGLPLTTAAWFYPGGGWVRPALLAQRWLAQAGSACRFIGGAAVERLQHDGRDWLLLDHAGATLARAPTLVLANAQGVMPLLQGLNGRSPVVWPVTRVRGQLSMLAGAQRHGLSPPLMPVAGAGYVLPAIDGQLVFGATSQPGDDDPAVRGPDHQHNLDRLAGLSPALKAAASLQPRQIQGRTAWRSVSSDRLPLIGAVPQAWVSGRDERHDQPRFVPREPGLFMFTALGSRGITWSPLGGQILAAAVTGGPVPLEAGLVDAVDPARFLTRAVRRQAQPSAMVSPARGTGEN